VNGWYYDCRQSGSLTPVSFEAYAYGAFTGQFNQLAELWSTYRLDSVEVQYLPLNPGAGYQSPCVSAIDPAGALGPVNAGASEIQLAVSRLRTANITPAFQKCTRRVDYRSWLTQTCP